MTKTDTHTTVPVLSIVTVCWNNLDEVKRTLASIRSQDFKDFELIVVDGGSDQELVNHIDHHADRYVSEPDDGVYDAMNKGIDLATGELLIFLNSGDTFYCDQSVSYLMQGREHPAFISNGTTITGATVYNHAYSSLRWIVRPNEASNLALPHMSTAVPTRLMKEYKFDTRFRVLGDIDLWHRMEQKNQLDVIVVSDIISTFEYGKGLSTNPKNNALKIFEKMMIYHLQNNDISASYFLKSIILYLRVEVFSRLPIKMKFWVWRKRHNWEQIKV